MEHPPTSQLIVNRAVDLREIDAVGFDLDHTLALYDDDAVNAIAMAEAQGLLVSQRGYRPDDVAAAHDPHDAAGARALALDLASAHVVKLDAGRRVRIARRGRVWLEHEQVVRAHPQPIGEHDTGIHPLSSRFDVPTLWLFEGIAAARGFDGATRRHDFDPARACRDARQTLDWSHTRGELKQRLVADLNRFVSGIPGVPERLLEWRRAGKRLFIVTNSEPAFASAVLEIAVGSGWRDLFAVVSMSSAKPRFFDRSAPTTTAVSGPLFEGAHAGHVEQLVGASGDRILYVGDNARADIRAARSFGWKTAHVVVELATPAAADDRWGSPFAAGDEASWFAHDVRMQADIVCDRVDRVLALDPGGRITPSSGNPLG